MKRGTTQKINFNVDMDLRQAQVRIIFKQSPSWKSAEIVKTNNDLEIAENAIVCKLSQEDTFKFIDGKLEMQIRYLFPDGTVGASNIMTANVERILEKEVMTWT